MELYKNCLIVEDEWLFFENEPASLRQFLRRKNASNAGMPIAPRAQVVESIFGLQLRNLLANATRLVEWRWGILFADTK